MIRKNSRGHGFKAVFMVLRAREIEVRIEQRVQRQREVIAVAARKTTPRKY